MVTNTLSNADVIQMTASEVKTALDDGQWQNQQADRLDVVYSGNNPDTDYDSGNDPRLTTAELEEALAVFNTVVVYDNLGPKESVDIPDSKLLSLSAGDVNGVDVTGDGTLQVRLFPESNVDFRNIETEGLDLSGVDESVSLEGWVTGYAQQDTIDLTGLSSDDAAEFKSLDTIRFAPGSGDDITLKGTPASLSGLEIIANGANNPAVRIEGVTADEVGGLDTARIFASASDSNAELTVALESTGTGNISTPAEVDVLSIPAAAVDQSGTDGNESPQPIEITGDDLYAVMLRGDGDDGVITGSGDFSHVTAGNTGSAQRGVEIDIAVSGDVDIVGASKSSSESFNVFKVNDHLASGSQLIGSGGGDGIVFGEDQSSFEKSETVSVDLSEVTIKNIPGLFLEGNGTTVTLAGEQVSGQQINLTSMNNVDGERTDETGSGPDGQTFRVAIDGNAGSGTFTDLSMLTFNTLSAEDQVFSWDESEDTFVVVGSEGRDDIITPSVDARIDAGDGDDKINAGIGDDRLLGGEGDDVLDGEAGVDGLTGGSGADTLDGGDGYDELVYANGDESPVSSSGVTVDFGRGKATDAYGDEDTFSGIEGVVGTANADTFTGDPDAPAYSVPTNVAAFSLAGFFNYQGLAGADTINGSTADGAFDRLDYSADADYGDTQRVDVDLGSGSATDGFGDTDTVSDIEMVRGTRHGDVLKGDPDEAFVQWDPLAGDDSIVGTTSSIDEVEYWSEVEYFGGTQGVSVDLTAGTGTGTATATDSFGDTDTLTNVEWVIGTRFGDNFWGSDADNRLTGMGGGDNFDASAGDDELDGGAGDDVVFYTNLTTDGIILNNTASVHEGVSAYTVDKTIGQPDNGSPDLGEDTLVSIEDFHVSSGDDRVYLEGGGYIFLEDGDDYLEIGDEGSVFVVPGKGADEIHFGRDGGTVDYFDFESGLTDATDLELSVQQGESASEVLISDTGDGASNTLGRVGFNSDGLLEVENLDNAGEIDLVSGADEVSIAVAVDGRRWGELQLDVDNANENLYVAYSGLDSQVRADPVGQDNAPTDDYTFAPHHYWTPTDKADPNPFWSASFSAPSGVAALRVDTTPIEQWNDTDKQYELMSQADFEGFGLQWSVAGNAIDLAQAQAPVEVDYRFDNTNREMRLAVSEGGDAQDGLNLEIDPQGLLDNQGNYTKENSLVLTPMEARELAESIGLVYADPDTAATQTAYTDLTLSIKAGDSDQFVTGFENEDVAPRIEATISTEQPTLLKAYYQNDWLLLSPELDGVQGDVLLNTIRESDDARFGDPDLGRFTVTVNGEDRQVLRAISEESLYIQIDQDIPADADVSVTYTDSPGDQITGVAQSEYHSDLATGTLSGEQVQPVDGLRVEAGAGAIKGLNYNIDGADDVFAPYVRTSYGTTNAELDAPNNTLRVFSARADNPLYDASADQATLAGFEKTGIQYEFVLTDASIDAIEEFNVADVDPSSDRVNPVLQSVDNSDFTEIRLNVVGENTGGDTETFTLAEYTPISGSSTNSLPFALFLDESFWTETEIAGSEAADRLEGGVNHDTIEGGSGGDRLYGFEGDDVLIGGPGNDDLVGGAGDDTLDASTGEVASDDSEGDWIMPGSGADQIIGSQQLWDNIAEGVDISYEGVKGSGGITLSVNDEGGAGTVTSTEAGVVDDTFTFAHRFRGTRDDDVMTGSANPDWEGWEGFAGNDDLHGNAGFDELLYHLDYNAPGGRNAVIVNFETGTATDAFGDTDTFTGMEAVRATPFDDTFTSVSSSGNGDFFRYRGLDGNDTINGSDIDGVIDMLDYSKDANYGGGAGIIVDLAAGTATDGFGKSDTFTDVEYVRGTDFGDIIKGDAADNRLTGFAGDDVLYAGDGDDELVASSGENVLFGGAGNDELVAGSNDDTLIGGAGNDKYVLGPNAGVNTILGLQEGDEILFDSGDGDELQTISRENPGEVLNDSGTTLNLPDYDSTPALTLTPVEFTSGEVTFDITMDSDQYPDGVLESVQGNIILGSGNFSASNVADLISYADFTPASGGSELSEVNLQLDGRQITFAANGTLDGNGNDTLGQLTLGVENLDAPLQLITHQVQFNGEAVNNGSQVFDFDPVDVTGSIHARTAADGTGGKPISDAEVHYLRGFESEAGLGLQIGEIGDTTVDIELVTDGTLSGTQSLDFDLEASGINGVELATAWGDNSLAPDAANGYQASLSGGDIDAGDVLATFSLSKASEDELIDIELGDVAVDGTVYADLSYQLGHVSADADGEFTLQRIPGQQVDLDAHAPAPETPFGIEPVVAFDALQALKIANEDKLSDDTSPSALDYIAADFDGNGTVEMADAEAILAAAVGKTGSDEPRWVFTDGKVSPTGNTAGNVTYDNGATLAADLDNLEAVQSVDFVGTLIGDVDASSYTI
ncbi:calcium-binding protein [Spiribacter roseus]|uniref:Uncharacterized protein n=1 Tax=Spiribacter roseus TaxID=1855875 RepID=A0ABV3RZA1_9GAMM